MLNGWSPQIPRRRHLQESSIDDAMDFLSGMNHPKTQIGTSFTGGPTCCVVSFVIFQKFTSYLENARLYSIVSDCLVLFSKQRDSGCQIPHLKKIKATFHLNEENANTETQRTQVDIAMSAGLDVITISLVNVKQFLTATKLF